MGYESHGLGLAEPVFMNVPLPDRSRKGRIYQRDGYDFRLKPGSRVIDAGCILPTITDNYTGKAPDLGAWKGRPLPDYGPRIKK
ncbi:MAG TPA: hypothetical protein VK666_30335 [Chryseolinea sp.]|nr:hypothetical protein [Chryseolinea sp.]